jgi:crotonobetainyl-CoA:carnitine CoA-transferase CaiB-like acyl-CoA transferase
MRPLEGIRILDLSRLLPGPYCTMLLADLGAEVLKLETPGLGDFARIIPPFITNPANGEQVGATFWAVNRNKKSVALNFRNQRGKQVFFRLARDVDVIVESFRAGQAEKWGIGYEAVRAVNPGIVYCSLSGYGQTGPYKDHSGHDLNYLSLSGLLAASGLPDGAPIPPAVQVADLSGAMLAAIAILATLIGRGKTGAGQYLDISLFDGALSWASTIVGGTFSAGGTIERGKMQLSGGLPCYNVYETREGMHLTLAAIEPHFWSTFCKTVGREDLTPRQQDISAIPEVSAIFKTRTLDEWLAVFSTLDACVEPVREYAEVFNDPHIKHRGLITQFGNLPQVGSVFVFSKHDPTPPPAQGQHTRETLARIGLSESEIDELAQAEIIKC